MGFFGDSGDHTGAKVENSFFVQGKDDLRVESQEILGVLITIAILLVILVVLRIVSMIKKATKRQATRDQFIMNRLPTNQ